MCLLSRILKGMSKKIKYFLKMETLWRKYSLVPAYKSNQIQNLHEISYVNKGLFQYIPENVSKTNFANVLSWPQKNYVHCLSFSVAWLKISVWTRFWFIFLTMQTQTSVTMINDLDSDWNVPDEWLLLHRLVSFRINILALWRSSLADLKFKSDNKLTYYFVICI